MVTQNASVKVLSDLNSSAVVKEFLTLQTLNREYDLFLLITQCSRVRKLQKQYYSCQDKTQKQHLLVHCKQQELALDKLGNQLWLKYKLVSLVSNRKQTGR